MATWHQQQADRRAFQAGSPRKLYHETEWTVVSDPPNDVRTLSTFTTKAKAEEFLAKIKAREPHSYILAPASERK